MKDYESFSNKPGSSRMFLMPGLFDGIHPNTPIDIVKKQMNGNKVRIGKNQIMIRHSIVDVDNMDVSSMTEAFG